jgi:hypothetical protein
MTTTVYDTIESLTSSAHSVLTEDTMSAEKHEIISAQVVLRPASGRPAGSDEAITSANVEQFLPSPAAAERVRKAFSARGFDVGPVVGTSFAITAPTQRFEELFGVRVRPREGGGIEAVRGGDDADLELPLSRLPDPLADGVAAVTFSPPPDFGPTSFGP